MMTIFLKFQGRRPLLDLPHEHLPKRPPVRRDQRLDARGPDAVARTVYAITACVEQDVPDAPTRSGEGSSGQTRHGPEGHTPPRREALGGGRRHAHPRERPRSFSHDDPRHLLGVDPCLVHHLGDRRHQAGCMLALVVQDRAREHVAPDRHGHGSGLTRGIEGEVTARIFLDATGQVHKVEMIDAKPEGVFDEAVISALEASSFSPAQRQGKAVPVIMRRTFHFSLRGQR